MGRFKGGGGKKKKGGGGGKKGNKGKQGGGKRGRPKPRRLTADEADPEAKKARHGVEEEEEEEELEQASDPLPAKRKVAKPSYNSLLQALGVKETEGDGEDSAESDEAESCGDEGENAADDEDEEEEGQDEEELEEGDDLQAVMLKNNKGRKDKTKKKPAATDGAVASQQVYGADGPQDDSGSDVESCHPAPNSNSASKNENDTDSNAKAFDMFTHFWDDPPSPAVPNWCSPTSASQHAATSLSVSELARHRFALPELERCESRHRDVSSVISFLQSPDHGRAPWSSLQLFPGLAKSFEEWLSQTGVAPGPRERALFAFMRSYVDVSFPEQTHLNARATRACCTLHIVDHVLKARRQVQENDTALSEAQEETLAAGEAAISQFGDQGFTRPRALILCAFRSVGAEIVRLILKLCPHAKQVMGKKKFQEQFADGPPQDFRGKPEDWMHLFNGNNDDCFCLGLSLRPRAVKLYSRFLDSDVLICSPLGLRRITGVEGERRRDFDFLSSIEICWIDRADVLRMQNWEHVIEVMQLVNSLPLGRQGIDISRLRPIYADGRGRIFRQTIVTSAGQALDIEAVFSLGSTGGAAPSAQAGSLAQKLSGKRRKRTAEKGLSDDEDEEVELDLKLPGVLSNSAAESSSNNRNCRGLVLLADIPKGGPMRQGVVIGISRQFFMHVPCTSLEEQSQSLLDAFEMKYWKPLGSSLERLLVVAMSYFNFLQIRRFFRKENTSFCSAFEYSKPRELTASRKRFNSGEKRVLLVTERFLWYYRQRYRGTDYVLFYGTPETPAIYEEILQNVRTPSQCNSMCLFTKFDGFALERIVGHERACKMLASPPGKVFLFS